jgi:putative oxidoreductase
MQNFLLKLTQPIKLPFWWQDFLMAIPRIACGAMLAFEFGAAKFGLPWSPTDKNLGFFEVAYWFPNDVAKYGGLFKIFPAFFAWMAAFAEAVGGLMLIVGFQTRIASFLVICTMLVVVFLHQIQYGLWNMLPGFGFLWAALTTLIIGSGRFGIDYLLTKQIK